MGEEGSGDGQLDIPYDIDIDWCSRVYVADRRNNRIVLFSAIGQFLSNVVTGQHGLAGRPQSLYVQNNFLYITNEYSPYSLFVVELT